MPFPYDTLVATAATVSQNPVPTRTWQWLRGGAAISGATTSNYVVQESDLGAAISIRQIETNLLGTKSATSAATDAITAIPVGALVQRSLAAIRDRADNTIQVRS